jgi:hypothetical protein
MQWCLAHPWMTFISILISLLIIENIGVEIINNIRLKNKTKG